MHLGLSAIEVPLPFPTIHPEAGCIVGQLHQESLPRMRCDPLKFEARGSGLRCLMAGPGSSSAVSVESEAFAE